MHKVPLVEGGDSLPPLGRRRSRRARYQSLEFFTSTRTSECGAATSIDRYRAVT
jgi:hypothetical protein